MFDDENWTIDNPKKKEINKVTTAPINTNNDVPFEDIGYKIAKTIGANNFWTITVTELISGKDNEVTRKCVYDDGDVENLSLNKLKYLKINAEHVKITSFNESLS